MREKPLTLTMGMPHWIASVTANACFKTSHVSIYTVGLGINTHLRGMRFRGTSFNQLNGLGLHTGFAVVGAILVHIYSVYQTQQTNQTIADSTVVFSLRLVQWLA